MLNISGVKMSDYYFRKVREYTEFIFISDYTVQRRLTQRRLNHEVNDRINFLPIVNQRISLSIVHTQNLLRHHELNLIIAETNAKQIVIEQKQTNAKQVGSSHLELLQISLGTSYARVHRKRMLPLVVMVMADPLFIILSPHRMSMNVIHQSSAEHNSQRYKKKRKISLINANLNEFMAHCVTFSD